MSNPRSTTKRALSRVRSQANLSEPLTRNLNAYALMAAASGVSLLASAMPAEAAATCQQLSIDLRSNSSYVLNPTLQVPGPFIVAQSYFAYSPITTGNSTLMWWNRAFFTPNTAGAKVLVDAKGLPADVAFGSQIGPNAQFGKGASYGELFTYGFGNFSFRGGGTKLKHRGNLSFAKDNYIGFQFSLAGQLHYGWARLRVTFRAPAGYNPIPITHVLGYGYETAPNTAIAAGSCSGDEKANAIEPPNSQLPPANLGLLALGNPALPAWRRAQPLLSESDFPTADHQRPAAK